MSSLVKLGRYFFTLACETLGFKGKVRAHDTEKGSLSMQASVVSDSNSLVLKVSGSLSFSDNKEWRVLVEDMLQKEAVSHVLDVTQLEMIDSAGLGMMLTMKQWAEDAGRRMVLKFDANSMVGSMIKLAKFNDMFDAEES